MFQDIKIIATYFIPDIDHRQAIYTVIKKQVKTKYNNRYMNENQQMHELIIQFINYIG
jgi:hypothetical protein